MSEQKAEWKVIVDLLRETNPTLWLRLGRKMMNHLFKINPTEVRGLLEKLNTAKTDLAETQEIHENQPMPRLTFNILELVTEETFQLAAREMSTEEIGDTLRLWVKQEQFRFLSMASEKRDVPLAEIKEAVTRFCNLPYSNRSLSKDEKIGIRVALVRRFFSEDLEFINSVKQHVSVLDFHNLMGRIIGPSRGNGKLGGKAAGLFRAERILNSAKYQYPFLNKVTVPKTWHLTTDALLEFMHYNALEEMPTLKYRELEEIRQEYNYVGQIFKNSTLPPEIMAGLNLALEDIGDRPFIVRSSSLLEDMKGSAFAGKYKSLFVANQGTKRERLEALKDAVLEVYASTFGPDPIEYRRERGLLDFNEEMGIMIQEVVGSKVGNFFFPAFAGVAFSYNEFRWSPRIKRRDGIIRLVTGLGTRAVDRMGDDFPLLVCPGQPGLRVNVTCTEAIRYAQKKMDLINLETGNFETVPVADVIKEFGDDFPHLSKVISHDRDGQLHAPVSLLSDLREGDPVVTFHNLLQQTPFVAQVKTILTLLHDSLGWPVDLEFAASNDVNGLCLLQCRPQTEAAGGGNVVIPRDIPPEDILFSAARYVTTGQIHDLEYIVYVDPMGYDQLPDLEEMVKVGRVVSDLNMNLPARKFILMGPGRWGSRGDVKLGVRVNYSDINKSCMLVEIARRKLDYVPELSFGTHFFQDLVEASIRYLPLYPDDAGIVFNERFFREMPNEIDKFAPGAGTVGNVLKVINVPAVTGGATLSILMDGDSERALAYLDRTKIRPQS